MPLRWEPFAELRRFRREMDRLLESFGREWERFGKEWPTAGSGYPPVNVWEDDNNIYLESEMPGMELNDLEIYVTGDQLTLKGERKPPQVAKGVWHRQEREFGRFTRVLTLPVSVDPEHVQARLVNGVLTVTLKKSPAAKPRKITVQAS
jgi:HSP20 family protein